MPNVYGPINHLLKYSTTFRKMPDTDDSTDGVSRCFVGLLPPPVVSRPRDVPLLVPLPDRPPAGRFPQWTNLLLRHMSLSLHRLVPFLGPDSHSH